VPLIESSGEVHRRRSQLSRLQPRRCGCCRHCCGDSDGVSDGGGGGCCAAQSMGVDTGGHLPCATAADINDDAAATGTATAAAATKYARSVSVSRVRTPAAGPSVVSVCVSTSLRSRGRLFVHPSVRLPLSPISQWSPSCVYKYFFLVFVAAVVAFEFSRSRRRRHPSSPSTCLPKMRLDVFLIWPFYAFSVGFPVLRPLKRRPVRHRARVFRPSYLFPPPSRPLPAAYRNL